MSAINFSLKRQPNCNTGLCQKHKINVTKLFQTHFKITLIIIINKRKEAMPCRIASSMGKRKEQK